MAGENSIPDNSNDQQQDSAIPLSESSEGLSAKISECEVMIDQLKDQLLRKAADFENYKKRIENDYSTLVKFSTEDLITKLLPVLDDFERSLKAGRQTKSDDVSSAANDQGFLKGWELIYVKLKKTLESQGLREFEVVGKPFDTQLHDALMQIARNDVPPHTVVEEVEKGYTLNDKVIRHARVIVSAEQQAKA